MARAKGENLAAGDVLFRQGEQGDSAFVIVDGELEVVVDLGVGTVEMAVLGPRQLVGEIAVFGEVPRTATVVARTAVRLLRLERADVMEILGKSRCGKGHHRRSRAAADHGQSTSGIPVDGGAGPEG